jgi:TM2 domain-containing membrane protein YozV
MAPIERYRDPADAALMTVVVYGLWFFLGWFGVHRFVTGRVGSGLVMLTLSLLGAGTIWLLGLGLIFYAPLAIWWVLDALRIPGWMR